MLLCDVADLPESDDYLLATWNEYAESARRVSIARRLDERAHDIRARYLAFVHDLGRTRVGAVTLIERLAARDGYSLWWTSTLAEKSPFKSPAIIECLKLLVLEEVLREWRPVELHLQGFDAARVAAIEHLARNMDIRVVRGTRRPGTRSLKDVFRALPAMLQAGVWLFRHQVPRLRLRGVHRVPWFAGRNALSFFSYFFNISDAGFKAGEFRPAQWGDLPQFCARRGLRTNWAHHLLLTPVVPSAQVALEWVRRFHEDAAHQGAHAFFDTFVSLATLWRATLAYLRIALRSFALREIRVAFTPSGSRASFWPLLAGEWRDSVRGRVAFQACVWIEAFDALLRELPRQQLGLFLQENQGWERVLIHAWRRHGHGGLVGVAHSTVRFWDLRYFDDPREYNGAAAARRPAPDAVALNGSVAERMYRDAGYPGKTVAVEALRFMHLARDAIRREHVGDATTQGATTVLVAGDSVREATDELLRCLAAALPALRRRLRVLFKPHPWCAIDLSAYGLAAVEQRHEPIEQLIGESDIVCGGISSVTLEAYCAGTGVVVFVARGSLNFSPMLGLSNVRMVRNPSEMAAALDDTPAVRATRGPSLFHLDAALPRWAQLFESHGLALAPEAVEA
jgi:surface carbohydrate biosynthesis protein (TIGR04326 family)